MEPTRRSAEPSNEAQPIQEEKKGVKEKTSMAAQREKIGKSHEAPEARKAPIKATRRLSSSPLGVGLKETAKLIEEHSGELWTCVDRIPNETGGYIYKFRLKDEYDDVMPHPHLQERSEAARNKIASIFPAIEKSGREIHDLDRKLVEKLNANLDARVEQIMENLRNSPNLGDRIAVRTMADQLRADIRKELSEEIKLLQVINELGYERQVNDKGVFFLAPDRETLLVRWEKLRETRPNLPQLDIVSSEGIADDLTFARAFLIHDALLSTGKEFVHDQLLHLIPILKTMLTLDNAEISREKFKLVTLVVKEYRVMMLIKGEIDAGGKKIPSAELAPIKEKIDQLQASLGALVDTMTSKSLQEALDTFVNVSILPMFRIWSHEGWNDYFIRRFAHEEVDMKALSNLHAKMVELIDDYYPSRDS